MSDLKASKVIFLDIDGVLVTLGSIKRGRSGLHAEPEPSCVEALNSILDSTGAKIVVSSTWRFGGIAQIRQILKRWGVRAKVIGLTPNLTRQLGAVWVSSTRGDEIRLWLASHPEVEKFVILDDDGDMNGLSNRLVQTEFTNGLTSEHAHRAIAML
jgi:Swiss Army Knife RNA repair-like protein